LATDFVDAEYMGVGVPELTEEDMSVI